LRTTTHLGAAAATLWRVPTAARAAAPAAAQRPPSPPALSTRRGVRRFGDGRDWFFQRRFGLFVHWGLYSIGGWHEQQQWRGRVPRAEYVKLREKWNPTRYDPDAWLDLALSVGMKYV
jgi:alpha-L-fucosidase